MVSVWAIRIFSFSHFLLLAIAIGLEQFGQAARLPTSDPTAMAGTVGLWVTQVIAWFTPAYLLASNAGNSGYTRPIKGLSFFYFLIVLGAIFLTFWIGYGSALAMDGADIRDWRASDIASVVFMSCDFLVVVILSILTCVTPTATYSDSTKSISVLAVVAMIAQLICLIVLLGVIYIWQGILLKDTLPTEGIIIQVGQFLTFATFSSAGLLLVIRSKEGGLLLQDFVWNIVTLCCHIFLLIMQVFIALGPKASTEAPAAVAVAFACLYSLIIVLLFVLTFKSWAQSKRESLSGDSFVYT